MANTPKGNIKSRKIAILAADGVDGPSLTSIKEVLIAGGAVGKIIAPKGGALKTAQGQDLTVDFTFLTAGSVLFDAVYVPDGEVSAATLVTEAKALHFINESFNHCKAIGATGAGVDVLLASALGGDGDGSREGRLLDSEGIVTSDASQTRIEEDFIAAVGQHRHWAREQGPRVPA